MGCDTPGSSPPPFFSLYIFLFLSFFCFLFSSLYFLIFNFRFSYCWRSVGRQFNYKFKQASEALERRGEERARHVPGDNLADCDLSIYLFLDQVFYLFIYLLSFLKSSCWLSLTHAQEPSLLPPPSPPQLSANAEDAGKRGGASDMAEGDAEDAKRKIEEE